MSALGASAAPQPGESGALTAELERSNAALEEFAYLCSHDLKEPLRGIHNYATYLKEDHGAQLDAAGCEKLDTLVRLARRMNEQIEALLEYSRVGRTQDAVRPTRMETVLGDVLETLGPALREHGVELRIAGPLPRVVCDGVRIAEVFRNLIGNAIKYRRAEQPWIEIGCRPAGSAAPAGTAEASASWPVFSVRDNGIGIAEEHFHTIFRMFKRLHSRDAYGGGVGAGLALVERILSRHGGWVRVESALGEGSAFLFSCGPSAGEEGARAAPAAALEPAAPLRAPLPGASAPAAPAKPAQAASAARPQGLLRVLVVDDDAPLLTVFERTLAERPHPWDVQFLGDPREALALVKEHNIDVLVSDLNMPGLPGDELLEQVRQHSPQTLRILMSSETDPGAVLRSIGPSQRFLAKPCGADELEEVIRTAWALREYLGDPLLAGAIGRIPTGPLFPGGAVELLEPTRDVIRGGVPAAQHLAARLLEQLRVGTAEGIDVNAFWQRASRAAQCADRIAAAERTDSALHSHAVLASLLHELGALILARYAPDLLQRSQAHALAEDVSAEEAQRATFRSTQDDVGAYVLGLWGLPDPVVEAVAFQRRPSHALSPGFAPVSITHVACALAHAPQQPAPGTKLPGLDAAYLGRLGLAERLPTWLGYCCE